MYIQDNEKQEDIQIKDQHMITVRPKLKGGSDKQEQEKNKDITVVCLNSQGFPSTRHNNHKL